MLVRVRSGALLGVGSVPVDVEVEAGNGMPGFHLVGLAGSAVQEAKVRVLAAIRNTGIKVPQKRVVVNLAPADLRKEGTGFDLPIAAALLAALGEVPADALAGLHFTGELSLSGDVKPVRGVLPLAIAARAAGARGLVCPVANGLEAGDRRGARRPSGPPRRGAARLAAGRGRAGARRGGGGGWRLQPARP